MDIVKLWDVEKEVLTYLSTHKAQYPKAIATALDKPGAHPAYINRSISTLLEKKLIEVVGKYTPTQGRPASKYSLTFDGVGVYILSVKTGFKEVLNTYRNIKEIEHLCKIYKILEEVDYKERDLLLSGVFSITLSLYKNVTQDPGDIEAMNSAWVLNQLKRKANKKQKNSFSNLIKRDFGSVNGKPGARQIRILRKDVKQLYKFFK